MFKEDPGNEFEGYGHVPVQPDEQDASPGYGNAPATQPTPEESLHAAEQALGVAKRLVEKGDARNTGALEQVQIEIEEEVERLRRQTGGGSDEMSDLHK